MPKKLYIRTFGCQMNEYDSDKMADVLHASEGFEKTEVPEEADVILFNTCSVREKAQEKVFSDLGRARLIKQQKPGLIIGVGGCVASQEGASIVSRAPYVDVVFGPQTLHRLPALIEKKRSTGRARLYRSWKVAANIAAFAWCPTRAVKKFRAALKTCSLK
jgi:tRNA-2-methylthio-N6-dimethylallyladenosine synthase